eukprot:TRINITY_DN25392_c0_g1_i1.p1 TRINITY_DN25392_c0_g1~~TRINITY_DN25392_c0_g1_i1.p1  ORF type:complete len:423 (-),score=125.60 TRINITY_DN25392_c0_g1_i1:386-1654(-)
MASSAGTSPSCSPTAARGSPLSGSPASGSPASGSPASEAGSSPGSNFSAHPHGLRPRGSRALSLPPGQSYSQRPPDDHLRQRVKKTLEQYPGIKDSEALINQKAMEGVERMRQEEQKHKEWLDKLKATTQSVFKMPKDQYAGKRDVEEEIMEKCEKAHKQMRVQDAQYRAWLEEVQERQKHKLQERLTAKKEESSTMSAAREEKKKEMQAKLAATQRNRAEKAARYWDWLSSTKEQIEKREPVIPLPKSSSAPNVDTLTAQKRAELTKENDQREREYKSWLQSVNKAKFTLPSNRCNSVAERDAIIQEKAKQGSDKLNAKTAEYKKWVDDMQQQQQEKMEEKVRKKKEADAAFDKERQERALELQRKMQAQKDESEKVANESQQQVKAMYESVRAKPLIVEMSYRFGPSFRPSSMARALGRK